MFRRKEDTRHARSANPTSGLSHPVCVTAASVEPSREIHYFGDTTEKRFVCMANTCKTDGWSRKALYLYYYMHVFAEKRHNPRYFPVFGVSVSR